MRDSFRTQCVCVRACAHVCLGKGDKYLRWRDWASERAWVDSSRPCSGLTHIWAVCCEQVISAPGLQFPPKDNNEWIGLLSF